MAKQDVLDAINATIVENGQKGITAQSLNNVLTMMTENAGEGGTGDGLLRLNVPMFTLYQEVYSLTENTIFNQAAWYEVLTIVEGQGLSLSNTNEAVTTIFAQNAEVLEQIWSKFEEGKYPVVTLDDSLMRNAYVEDIIPSLQEQYPEYSEEQIRLAFGESILRQSMLALTSASEIAVAESEGDYITVRVLEFLIYSVTNDDEIYNTGDVIVICLDDSSDAGVTAGDMMLHRKVTVNLYFPQDGATLSSVQMLSNVYTYWDYSSSSDDNQASLIKYFTPHLVNAEGNATAQKAPFFITADFHNKKFKYFDGLSLKEAVIASDGSVTVTTLGSLTAPTTEVAGSDTETTE